MGYIIIFGFVIGTLLILGTLLCYSKITQASQLIEIQHQTLKLLTDTTKKNSPASLNEINIKIVNLDEQITSLNKRFDDFYIMGSIVVVLLLAINVGVFVNIEWKIERYFKSNFDGHLGRIMDYEKKSSDMFGRIKARSDYIQQTFDLLRTEQTVPQNEPTQNDTNN